MLPRIIFALALFALVPFVARAQGVRPKDIVVAPHWHYDDLPAALAKAKDTGKPILALFR